MSDTRLHSKTSRTAAIAVAGAAVLCAVVAVALGTQLGAASFDPNAFLDLAGKNQPDPEYGAAYDVNRTEADGEATMDANDPEDSQPDIQELDASLLAQDQSSASSALSLTDSPTGTTVLTGQGGSGEGTPGSTVTGPIVNGDGNGGEGGDPSPDDPTPTDPDPAPTLPTDIWQGNPVYPGGSQPFPDEGMPSTPGTEDESVRFVVYTESDLGFLGSPTELGMSLLYRGMALNEQKLLCAGYYYVIADGTIYRLEQFGENFKVGSYPSIVDSDKVRITFSFRMNSSSKWIDQTAEFPVHPCKVLVQGWDKGEYLQTSYPDTGESVDLGSLYASMLPAEVTADPWSAYTLDSMFVGWSETEGGRPVGTSYVPQATGLILLTPLPLVPVPSDFVVECQFGSQVLVSYTGAGPVCSIPEGVQEVNWTTDFIQADVIRIPGSLQSMDGWEFWLEAGTSFSVAEGNPAYYAQNGLLMRSSDDALVGIPSNMAVVDVPPQTTSITFPLYGNSITELRFSGEPFATSFAGVENAEIVVPTDRYLDFLAAWGSNPGNDTNRLVPDSGEVPDYVISGDGVYSQDGKTLYQVLSAAEGVFVAQDGIELVKADALANCPDVDTVVLPGSVAKLEEDALAGYAGRVLLSGDVPPSVGPDVLDGAQFHVHSDAYAAYLREWGQAYGEDAVAAVLQPNDFAIDAVNGYSVLQDHLKEADGSALPSAGNQVIVLSAPADATLFDGTSLGGLQATGINKGAFSGCAGLRLVTLPESIKAIGAYAFADCAGLQAFFSASTDTISIGSGAFDGCMPQAAAFSAQLASVADLSGLIEGGFSAYAPYGSSGYEDPYSYDQAFTVLCPSYHFTQQGNGMILYGIAPDDPGYLPGLYVLGATAGVNGEVTFEPGTTVVEDYSFSHCTEPYTLNAASMESLLAIGTFAFSSSEAASPPGLTGTLSLPGSLSVLSSSSFARTNLTSVHIDGANLDTVADSAFYGCASLTEVTFGSESAVRIIDSQAFAETGIGSIALPNSVETIGEGAFYGCKNLTSIDLPASVSSLDQCPFGESSVRAVTMSSAAPPSLITYYFIDPYPYGFFAAEESVPDFRITLAGDAAGKEAAYIEAWTAPLMGYADSSEMTPDEQLAGINKARALFGMDPLESLPDQAAEASEAAEASVLGASAALGKSAGNAENAAEGTGSDDPDQAGEGPEAPADGNAAADAGSEGADSTAGVDAAGNAPPADTALPPQPESPEGGGAASAAAACAAGSGKGPEGSAITQGEG